jgi:TonB family protein
MTRLLRVDEDEGRAWMALSYWRRKDGILLFSDYRTGRAFRADLARATLGGTWRTETLIGGWWCSASPDVTAATAPAAQSPSEGADTLMPPLVSAVMATPNYPREAIQRGLEGRAVVCFTVDAAGAISDPQLIELSNELFREPTLSALARSRYRSRKGDEDRPACRSYIYRLDAIR